MRKFCSQYLHPSWHFYAAMWGIIIGTILGLALRQIFIASQLWWIVILLSTIIVFSCPTRTKIALAFIIGILISNLRLAPELFTYTYFENLIGTSLTLRGKIFDDPVSDASGTTIKLHKLWVVSLSNNQLSGTLYVKLPNNQNQLEKSDIVTLKGKLSNGFGTFVASMYRPEIFELERSETGDVFARVKHWFAGRIREFISDPQSELGLGYLMGMKSSLPENLLASLQIVGMTHVIVASGAHLGILTNTVKKFFGKISKFASLLFSLLLIFAFVGIVGFTPSMTRAGLVSILTITFGYVGRKFTPLRLLSFTAALTLLIEPNYFLNLGWQLSFASFFAILIFAPKLQKTLYSNKKPPWLASMLITSISTLLVCMPILIYNFGSLSILSLVVNLVILPTLPYAMLFVFLTGITSFLPILASLFGYLSTLLLDLHLFVINFFSEKTMFVLSFPGENPAVFLFYIPLVIFLSYTRVQLKMKQVFHLEKTKEILYNEHNES